MRNRWKVSRVKVVLASILALFSSFGLLAPAARANPVMGPAYYLYSKHQPNVHANCIYSGIHLYKYLGSVGLDPHRRYKLVQYKATAVGNIHYDYYNDDAFSSAAKYSSCVHGDIDFSYYGLHKVQRTVVQVWYCSGGACTGGGVTYGSWRNKNWT